MVQHKSGVLAIFSYLDTFCDAIEKIRDKGSFEGHEVLSPTSYHEIEHACGFGSSGVRAFTLVGGLTGVTLGFLMCLWMDYDYPLVVGGKTAGFASIPAYVILGFELTILLGAISTILGILILGRVPNPKVQIFDERLTDNKFGIFLPNVGESSEQVTKLKELGAEEIKVIRA